MKILILLVCLIVMSNANADAYKCKNSSGKFEYQDSPCTTGEKMKLQYDSIPSDPDAANIHPDVIANYETLISQKKVGVGMTAKMTERAWGKPHRVNTTVGRNGRSEQWIYDRGSYVFDYVYVENGIVKSVQVSK